MVFHTLDGGGGGGLGLKTSLGCCQALLLTGTLTSVGLRRVSESWGWELIYNCPVLNGQA